MALKEFLKPTKIKIILTALVLVIVSFFLFQNIYRSCLIVSECEPGRPETCGAWLDYSCFFRVFTPRILISLVIIYFFACLFERLIKSAKRKQKKESVIWLACLIGIVISVVLVFYVRTVRTETRNALISCKESEVLLREQLEEANYCETEEDCKIEFFDCPFGCGSYVNGGVDIALIKEQISSYVKQCGGCKYKCMRPLNPVCQNQKCVEAQAFCEPDKIYVILDCNCPEGTAPFVFTPFEGSEEAVWICKTNTTCKDDDFYAQQAMSFKYKVQGSSVTVSGCLANHPGSGCQEKTLNLSPGQEFYLASGKEQSVSVKVEKIENNKAYFLFSYGAAPPACETVGGCDYSCEFVKE